MAVITGRHRLTFPPGPSNRMMPHWNVLESYAGDITRTALLIVKGGRVNKANQRIF